MKSLVCFSFFALLLATFAFAQEVDLTYTQPPVLLNLPSAPRGCAVVNACFDRSGPYSFYGRSLFLMTTNTNNSASPELWIHTLDRYQNYIEGMIPENQVRNFAPDPLFNISPRMAVVERGIGAEYTGHLNPKLLDQFEDPMIILAGESSGAFKLVTLFDSTLSPVFFGEDFAPNFHPQAMAFDNDNLRLYVVNGDRYLHVFNWFLDSSEPTISYAGNTWLIPFIGTRPVINADFIEGNETLLLFLDNPKEVIHLDVHILTSPLLTASTFIAPSVVTLAASDGFCNLNVGTSQWVGLRENTGLYQVGTTPCAPSPLPMPYPVAGTYLEPRMGFSIAVDNLETIQGPIEIRPWVSGPWWPNRVRGLISLNGGRMTEFDLDNAGEEVAEITFAPGGFGDGWRLNFTPTNETEEDAVITCCYEIERNGALIYIQDTIRIQDFKEPDIINPSPDGSLVDPNNPGTGVVQHPSPAHVDCTVVMRREVENPVADDVPQVPQRRAGLPIWWFKFLDENGQPDSICIEGGTHCAPASGIQSILAHAQHNACLCHLINCFLGRAPDADCDPSSFTEEQLTVLVLAMGVAMETNKNTCGSPYNKACDGIEDFINILRGLVGPDCDCDPKIYCHFIGADNPQIVGWPGRTPAWAQIVEEMDEKKQVVQLRITRIQGTDTIDHRITIKSISKQVGDCVEIEIEDPEASSSPVIVVVNTATIPPSIKSYEFADPPFWQYITGAIAVSDSTPPDDGGDRHGSRSLDFEYHTWEHVLTQVSPGPITSFPLTNLTPGQWKYRVRDYLDGGDSATTYRLIYVPTPAKLVINRVGNSIQLNWRRDPAAVEYEVQTALTPDGFFGLTTITPDTFFITSYNPETLKFYRVQSHFTAPPPPPARPAR